MGQRGEFAHCRVCRRNHDQGKGHRYSASHKKALEQMLAKASDRIRGIRSWLESPAAASEGGHRFWCWFCEEDVVDRDSLFAWSKGIYHLASSKHLKSVKKFCIEQGLDVKRRSDYSFTHKDVEKWEADCNLVASSKQGAATSSIWPLDAANNIQQTESQNLVLSCSSVDPLLAVLKDEKTQVPKQQQDPVRRTGSASGESLASVVVPALLPGEGNVHTGAPPPWMTDVTSSNKAGEQVNGRTMSKRQQREAQRLERRVGAAWAKRRRAELERDKAVAATAEALSSNWLPSFGGVWQSGTRSESRKAFLESANFRAVAERGPPKVEPYIGKRKRTATNRDGAGGGVLESSG